MNIWQATSVEETPQVVLRDWRIIEASSEYWDGRTRHFCGFNEMESEGRVSSAIVGFDKERMIGKTESGRIYQLIGPAGLNSDALYVWGWFAARNKLLEMEDVSHEY